MRNIATDIRREWSLSCAIGRRQQMVLAASLVLALVLASVARAEQSCFISERLGEALPMDDWIGHADPNNMQAHPSVGATVRHNPPILRWPAAEGASGYEVRLIAPSQEALSRDAANNWLFLGEALDPGEYQWQVRYHGGGSESPWSAPRSFIIAGDAAISIVPDFAMLLERARSAPHPRAIPRGEALGAMIGALKDGPRRAEFDDFLRRTERSLGRTVDSVDQEIDGVEEERDEDDDPPTEQRASKRSGGKDTKRIAYKEAGRVVDAAYAWIATREDRFRDEAKRRALVIAQWDTQGPTGTASDDLASQRIAFSLAQAYDILHERLSEDEREVLRRSIAIRTEQLLERYVLDPTRGLAHKPQNSHGFRDVGAIAAIAVLLAGDLPEAEDWYFATLPLFVAVLNPWGGEDGGYTNGTNYAVADLVNLLTYWDTIRNATGLDIAQLPWPQAVGRFLFAFLPPGAPVGVFGDGADADHYYPERWARAAALYAQRVPLRLNRLYAESWNQKPKTDRLYVFAPPEPDVSAEAAAAPCNGAFFPSIGAAAMHSDIADPKRTSVYFKSSPYGSKNHSHADQNSFVIHANGVPLAIDSGFYDSYRSAHRRDWTAQTKAHNAITFDGGQGQKTGSIAADGRIVAYSHTAEIDMAVGDATVAYGGALTKARRTLAYLRPDTVLIYDLLESGKPRRWEWNIHSLVRFAETEAGNLRIENGPAALCLNLLEGPVVRFTQAEGFPVPPRGRKERPDQWHGRFTATEASKATEFLVLLSVGCRTHTVSHERPENGEGFTVAVDGTRVLINADGAVPE